MAIKTYTGVWNENQAAHLLRRTLFGPTYTQIKAAQNAYQKMMNEQMQKYLADLRENALKQQEQEGDVQNSGTTGFSGIQG